MHSQNPETVFQSRDIPASVSNLEIAQFVLVVPCIVFGLFSAPSLVLLSCWFGSHGLRVTPSGVTTTEAEEAVASYRNATISACEKPLCFCQI